MRGYLLIFTSGVLFFIIAVVTVIHLMSAKALKQQYRLNQSYQYVLDVASIKNIIAYAIDQNFEQYTLPSELSAKYSLSHQMVNDLSYDFSIQDNETGKVVTFNLQKEYTQAGESAFDPINVAISNNSLTGLSISSTVPTHLVSLRTVWYPFNPMDYVSHYSLISDSGDETIVTANTQMGVEFDLESPISDTNRLMTVYFSTLPETGAISIYFKYSDGSIQNAHIEF